MIDVLKTFLIIEIWRNRRNRRDLEKLEETMIKFGETIYCSEKPNHPLHIVLSSILIPP